MNHYIENCTQIEIIIYKIKKNLLIKMISKKYCKMKFFSNLFIYIFVMK